MTEERTVTTECGDDIPLLIEWMEQSARLGLEPYPDSERMPGEASTGIGFQR